MAGMSGDTGSKGGRRSVDSEINMIPMIDLLVCCISFLLITAVWSHMSRINVDAQVPGQSGEVINPLPSDKMLHVQMRNEDHFTLVWKQGGAVIDSMEVPRHPVRVDLGSQRSIRYPDLATRVDAEWRTKGSHRDSSDHKADQAVLHTDDKTEFEEIVAVIDALHTPRRDIGAAKRIPAFNVTFSVD
jgi:biopolymer transport protein ExbD